MPATPQEVAPTAAGPTWSGLVAQLLLMCVPFAAGVGTSVQSAMNARLGMSLVSQADAEPAAAGVAGGFLASTVSFAVGCCCSALLALTEAFCCATHQESAYGVDSDTSTRRRRQGDPHPPPRTPGAALPRVGCTGARAYEYLGGGLGAFFVTTSLLLGPVIGFGLYFVLLVCGQLAMSSALDHTGVLGVAKSPTTPLKAGGLVLSLAGALLSVAERVRLSDTDDGGPSGAQTIMFCLVALGAGVCTGLQAPLNWRLGYRLQSKFRAASVSFLVGWLSVGVVCVVAVATTTDFHTDGANAEWYLYVGGGVLGAGTVVAAIILLVQVGVALFFSAVIAGQLTGSMLLDATGAFSFTVREPTALRVIGTVVVLVGTSLLNYAKHLAVARVAPAATTPGDQHQQPHHVDGRVPQPVTISWAPMPRSRFDKATVVTWSKTPVAAVWAATPIAGM